MIVRLTKQWYILLHLMPRPLGAGNPLGRGARPPLAPPRPRVDEPPRAGNRDCRVSDLLV